MMMIHACVDYPFPRPAVSSWMFFMLALLYMSGLQDGSRSREARRDTASNPPAQSWRLPDKRGLFRVARRSKSLGLPGGPYSREQWQCRNQLEGFLLCRYVAWEYEKDDERRCKY